MGKPDQGSAAAEGDRRRRRARPWRPIVSGAEARGGAASVARGGSRVGVAGGGDHRGAGLTVARPVSGRGPGQPEEPGAGCPERRRSSAAGQDRRAADGERVTVREGGPAGGGRPFGPAEVEAMRGAHSISTRRAYGLPRIYRGGTALAPASTRGGRRQRPRCRVGAAGRSARPRTTSWSATFAGCSKRRPFMAKGTGRPGRSSGSRESALRRTGCAG